MAESEIRRYQVPNHLKTDDQLSIGFFTFTFRQLTLLVLGGGAAYELWMQGPWTLLASSIDALTSLGDGLVTGLKVSLVVLLVLLALALAFVRRRGRTLDTWCFVWLRYVSQPRAYSWRRLADPALGATLPALPVTEESEEE